MPGALLRAYYTLANQCGLTVAAVDYFGHSAATAAGASFSYQNAEKKAKKREKKAALSRGGAVEPQLEEAGGTAVAAAEEDTTLYLLAEPEHLVMTFVQSGQVKLQRLLSTGDGEFSEAQITLDYFGTMDAGRGSRVQAEISGARADDARYVASLRSALEIPISVQSGQPGSEWISCLGAAQTQMDFGAQELNRTSRGTKKRSISRAWQYGLILVGGALLAGSIALTLGLHVTWDSKLAGMESSQRSLQLQAAENQGNASRYQEYDTLYQNYSTDWDMLFASLSTYNNNIVLVLEELETILPSETTVTGVTITDSGLSLELNCTDKEEAAYLIMKLRSLNYASLDAISNLTINGQSSVAAASGVQSEEQPPATGSSGLDYTALVTLLEQSNTSISAASSEGAASYADIWKFAIDKGLITENDLKTALMSLTPEQLAVLEAAYGTPPATSYTLEGLLKTATFDQRVAALEAMLTEDQIGIYRFFLLVKEDVERPAGTEILFPYISSDLWENSDLLIGVFSGDPDSMDVLTPVLVEMLTKDEETLSAAEELIQTDADLSGRLAYYLAVEMGLQTPKEGVGSIDTDRLIADLENGTMPEDVEAVIEEALSGMTDSSGNSLWDMLNALIGASGNGSSGDGSGSTDGQTGSAGKDVLDELLNQYVGGQLDDDTLDALLSQYMGGTVDDGALEELVQGYLSGSGGTQTPSGAGTDTGLTGESTLGAFPFQFRCAIRPRSCSKNWNGRVCPSLTRWNNWRWENESACTELESDPCRLDGNCCRADPPFALSTRSPGL